MKRRLAKKLLSRMLRDDLCNAGLFPSGRKIPFRTRHGMAKRMQKHTAWNLYPMARGQIRKMLKRTMNLILRDCQNDASNP